MSRFTAVLDACVLFPFTLRDTLLTLAEKDFYRPLWSQDIHREWIEAVLSKYPDVLEASLLSVKEAMDTTFEEAVVTGYEPLMPVIGLPDHKDRHVLAAAIHAKADALVTFNLKDFPADCLRGHNIEPIHPDDFIQYQFDLNPLLFAEALEEQRLRLTRPSISEAELIKRFERMGLPQTAAILGNL